MLILARGLWWSLLLGCEKGILHGLLEGVVRASGLTLSCLEHMEAARASSSSAGRLFR